MAVFNSSHVIRRHILLIILAVFVYFSSNDCVCANDLLAGVGAVGDSLTDEYSRRSVNYGDASALCWVDLLAQLRGPASPVPELTLGDYQMTSMGSPRGLGYTYNWALGGANTATLLSQGQHTGIATQVRENLVQYVAIFIGSNDFNPFTHGAYRAIYADTMPFLGAGDMQYANSNEYVDSIVARYTTALDTVSDAGANIIMATIADFGVTPLVIAEFPNGQNRQRVTNVIRTVNDRLRALAAARVLPIVDIFELANLYLGSDPLMVGGIDITRGAPPSANSKYLVLPDRIHPGTVWQGLLANAFIEASNRSYGTNFTPLSDQEILSAAGVDYASGDETFFDIRPFVITQYSGGTGEPNDPYQIATADDLMLLGESPEDYDKHFILTADIDLDPNLPGRKVFDKAVIAPDINKDRSGFQGLYFTGVFNGNNHIISNLVIIGEEYVGFFGLLDSGTIIQNLGLGKIEINGTNRVGGLAGINDGHIVASYSSGTVSGTGWAVGGLVGDNDGRITGSFYSGTVSGGDLVGGLVGTNWDRIIMSYSTGTVSGNYGIGGLAGENFGSADFGSYARITTSYSNCMVNGTSNYIGGLVGCNSAYITASYSSGAVSGPDQAVGGLVGRRPFSRSGISRRGTTVTSFWDVQTSGQTTSSGGTGLNTAEMQEINTYLYAGWDFVGESQNGTCDYWQISPDGYPELRFPVMPEGLGTTEQPYLIKDALDLGTVWFQPAANYCLEASIDLSNVTWSLPVVPRFDGNFDGNGFVISNFHIEGDRLVGLFGLLGDTGKISNLRLEAVDVNGTDDYVGGLVGLNYGTITSSYTNGFVRGNNNYIGGLVGGHSGTISDCSSSASVSNPGYGSRIGGLVGISYGNITTSYSVGSVFGISSIGGLVGSNSGNITTSYSMSAVSGETNIGGLAGSNWGSITTSYSTGSVKGDSEVGGLVGDGNSNVIGGFWDIETSGQITSASGTGKTTAEMQIAATFETAGWGCNIVWKLNEGYDYPRLLWEEGPGEPITAQLFEFLEGKGTSENPYIVFTLQDINIATSFICEQDKQFRLGFLSGQGTQNDPYMIYSAEEINLLTICPYEHDAYYKLGFVTGEGSQNDPYVIYNAEEINLLNICPYQQDAYYRLGFVAGEGTKDDPYALSTAEQLDLLNICPYELDKNFILTEDINLDPELPSRKVFDKSLINSFSGIFNGNDHTISNLTISGEGSGLFGKLESGAELKNLFVVDVNVVSLNYCVGGLVAYNEGDISNCCCTGVVSGDSYVGGLVGKNHGSITGSYSTGTFTGGDYVGGLVGWNKGDITNCYSIGEVEGSEDVGGLAGSNIGSVNGCYSTSRVSGSMYVGGLVGRNGGDIIYSYSTGATNGRVCVGGLVGNNWGVAILCYSTGTVSGSGAIGGLIGQGKVVNAIHCFWDIETSGWSTSSGGTGKTTTEMQTTSTFLDAGWDFVGETTNGTEDIWKISEGLDYPRLWWELISEN
jgi:hypothetical protein